MKIVEKIKMAVMGLSAVAALGAATMVAPGVYAADQVPVPTITTTTTDNTVTNSPAGTYTGGTTQQAATGRNDDLMSVLTTIINVALGVIGFVAVVMIIMGGVQYTTSSGDTAKVTKAKNTILYGIIGLVVALLAFAIVNFVLANVFKTA